MFNAVLPFAPLIIAIQVDEEILNGPDVDALLQKLESFFMVAVVVVAWDKDAKFKCRGAACSELDLISEELVWREFDLPAEPEMPF